MKRWELFALQIFAVACSYLLTSLMFIVAADVAQALDVKIFAYDDQETSADLSNFPDFVDKNFRYPYQNNYQYIELILTSKLSSYIIKKVYLYRCKDFNPSECIENGIDPVISVNQGSGNLVFDETYRWNDVSSNDVANFLILAKLDVAGKDVWTGSWNKISKTGIQKFSNENYRLDRLNVYLKSGVAGETVKNYIENYHSIPSDNVNHSVFETVSGSDVNILYDLSANGNELDPSGTEIPSMYPETHSGDVLGGNLRTWDFVLAGDGKVADPVAFYSTVAGPPITGGASLVADDWSPQVITCGSSEIVNINLHVDNASNIGNFQSYYYKIDGVESGQGAVTCTITDPGQSMYAYQCSIPVSSLPVCNAPGTSTITVYFNYLGGVRLSAGFPVTLNAPEPVLVVDSILPAPFDCEIDTELTAQLRVSNPTAQAPEKYYTFDGTNFHSLSCTGSGSSYACEIQEGEICALLQEDLELTFKFVYGELEILSIPLQLLVTFPPPSMSIDTVTPQTLEAGETASVNALLHVNYPDIITFDEDDFSYNYLNKGFQPATCSLETSYTNIRYYKCPVSLEIPGTQSGVKDLTFRLDGYMEGELKQLTAKSFLEIVPPPPPPGFAIVSTSSPVECVTDDFVTAEIKHENVDTDSISEYKYTFDTVNYADASCTVTGNTLSCSMEADELCDQMKNVLSLKFSFKILNDTHYSNSQKVYFRIPEPHLQVYSVQPDTLPSGQTTSATVNLYVQNPQMLGDSPSFVYTHLGKINRQMSCTKVSSTGNRDFYECSGIDFEIPEDYSQAYLSVLFSVQGAKISFPMNIRVADVGSTTPSLEIVSTTPHRIELRTGNETSASFHVTVHNALAAGLEHQATLIPNSWISSGVCEEVNAYYDFKCDVTVKAPQTAKEGQNPVTLSLKVGNGESYEISDTTNVYVLAKEKGIEIQSTSPSILYCEGQQQQNPETVKVTGTVKNVGDFELVEEDISFNDAVISHTARYCTYQGRGIDCEIPTDKFFEKVTCGRDELAPGEGTMYYPLSIMLLVETGGNLIAISGSKDVSIAARPLAPYLDITDNDISGGKLSSPVNCLAPQAIKLGDTGYVRIMYADLLHPEPKADDLEWSYKLEASDDEGKLSKGMGVSPDADSIVCKMIDYQKVGVHRVENYECSLYTSTKMFQRCGDGTGEITLVATSGGKKAEGIIDVDVIRDDSRYVLDMQILTHPMDIIECQIQGQYGAGVKCSLASHSNQNVSIKIKNTKELELTDLNLYDFDVSFTGGAYASVKPNPKTLGTCRKEPGEAYEYVCPFQIGPTIILPETSDNKFNVTKEPGQTFPSIPLGRVNMTVYVKYADDLARDVISRPAGTITIQPKKSNAMINAEKMLEKMRENFGQFQGIFKGIIKFLAFCGICAFGNKLITTVDQAMSKNKNCDISEKTPDPTDSTNGIDYKLMCSGYKTCEGCAGNSYLCQWNSATKKCTNICMDFLDPGVCIYTSTQCKYPSSLSPASDADYQPETSGVGFDDGDGKSNENVCDDSWGMIISIIVGAVTLLVLFPKALKAVTGKDADLDEEEKKSELSDALEKGLAWGFIACVLPRLLGEAGAALTKGKLQETSKDVAAFGEGFGKICESFLGLAPFIMSLIRFYINYLQFEMCMDMVQSQVESTAYAAAQVQGEAQQAQATTQAGISTMTQMMGCFNTLSQSMTQLSNSMTMAMSYMGNSYWGGGQFSVVYFHSNSKISPNIRALHGKGLFRVRASNLCGGNSWGTASVEIIGECCGTKKDTRPCGSTGGRNYNAYNVYGAQGNDPTLEVECDIKADCFGKKISVVARGPKGSHENKNIELSA